MALYIYISQFVPTRASALKQVGLVASIVTIFMYVAPVCDMVSQRKVRSKVLSELKCLNYCFVRIIRNSPFIQIHGFSYFRQNYDKRISMNFYPKCYFFPNWDNRGTTSLGIFNLSHRENILTEESNFIV